MLLEYKSITRTKFQDILASVNKQAGTDFVRDQDSGTQHGFSFDYGFIENTGQLLVTISKWPWFVTESEITNKLNDLVAGA